MMWRTITVALVAAMVVAQSAQAVQKEQKGQKEQKEEYLNLSLDADMETLDKIKAGLAKDPDAMRRAKEAYEQRGIDIVSSAISNSKDKDGEIVIFLLDQGLKPREEHMYRAAAKGKIKVLEKLLKCGLDVNGSNGKAGPICDAAQSMQCEAVKFLLDHGADIEGKGKDGKNPSSLSPLSFAVGGQKKQDGTSDEETALLLIARGASFDKPEILKSAVRNDKAKVVKALLDKGVNGNGGGSGLTPLERACMYKSLKSARVLLEHGVTITQKAIDEAEASDCNELVTLFDEFEAKQKQAAPTPSQPK
jgi:ankyrin repeat protein